MIGIKTRLDYSDYAGRECHRLAPDRTSHRVAEATGAAVLRHPDWPGLEISLGDLWR